MIRFKNPEMRVVFTTPVFSNEDETVRPQKSVHKFLCTSNVHFQNNLAMVYLENDPFLRTTHVPLNQVSERLSCEF